MRSPFPGMDPWLEFHWRDVHARLIIYIADQLQRHLPAPLVARAEETVSVDIEEDKPVMVRPDMAVSEDWRGAGDNGGVATAVEPTTVADPLVLYAPEIEFDRHVEIYDPTGGGRVVTAIEVLSPSNKLPGRARKAYESKQRLFLSGGVNLVEIDLVREGEWVFSIDESVMPARKRTPCMICVFRATRPGERAAYPLPLRERLPRIAIPLRPTDRDVALDLQTVVDEAYEKDRYDRTDYRRPLAPPLPAEDAVWGTRFYRKPDAFEAIAKNRSAAGLSCGSGLEGSEIVAEAERCGWGQPRSGQEFCNGLSLIDIRAPACSRSSVHLE